MKLLTTLTLLGFICTTQTFASYEVIGETRDCPILVKVVKETTTHTKSGLLIIQDSAAYQLKFVKKVGSMEYYSSVANDIGRGLDFDAIIMGKEMSRLSELRIYWGTRKFDCFIER